MSPLQMTTYNLEYYVYLRLKLQPLNGAKGLSITEKC